MFSSLGWWEYSVYIGLAGFLFIVVFGIILWTRQKDRSLGYPALLLPTLGVALLSLGQIYRIMRLIPIPLLSGERASIRMIALPFVVITIIAALQFQKWLGARKPGVVERIAWLGISGIIFHDLWQHLKAWQVTNAYHAFPNTPVNLAIKVVSNHPDPAYFSILWIGLIVSLFGMLLLSGLIYLEKNNTNKAK
jgi:hypothetical protein